MKPIKNIIIFGASAGGEKALLRLSKENHVLAFTDNNQKNWGKTCCGYPIIPPTEIHLHAYHQIVVASSYWYEIYPQLLHMGLDREKIIVDYQVPPFALPWKQYIIGTLLFLVMVYYIFFIFS